MAIEHTGSILLTLSGIRTMEALFAVLRDIPFEAGHPGLLREKADARIVWPRMDRYNQVQIIREKGSFFCVCSGCPRQEGSRTPGSLHALLGIFSKQRAACISLTKKTGQQINALGL